MYEDWPTITEAVKLTGISERTFQRMIQRNEIQREYRKPQGRKEVVVLDPDKIKELQQKARHPVPAADTTAMVPRAPAHPAKVSPPAKTPQGDMAALMALLQRPQVRLAEKFLLTTNEAAELSGLSVDHLRKAGKQHLLPAIKGKGYKFRPQDLQHYVDSLLDSANGANGVTAHGGIVGIEH